MNWIKSALVVTFISVVSLKAADLTFGAICSSKCSTLKMGERSIVLREFSPKQELFVASDTPYQRATDGLESKEFFVRTDSKGFLQNGNLENQSDANALKILFLGGSTTASRAL